MIAPLFNPILRTTVPESLHLPNRAPSGGRSFCKEGIRRPRIDCDQPPGRHQAGGSSIHRSGHPAESGCGVNSVYWKRQPQPQRHVVAHLVLEPGYQVRSFIGGQLLQWTAQHRLAEQVPELEHPVVRPRTWAPIAALSR